MLIKTLKYPNIILDNGLVMNYLFIADFVGFLFSAIFFNNKFISEILNKVTFSSSKITFF
jgi:hypothetical protein